MNITRTMLVASGLFIAAFALIGDGRNGFCVAQTPKDLNPLSAEVMALQALHQLQLTPAQQAELERRLTTLDHDRTQSVTWETLKAELEQRCP